MLSTPANKVKIRKLPMKMVKKKPKKPKKSAFLLRNPQVKPITVRPNAGKSVMGTVTSSMAGGMARTARSGRRV